MRLTQKINNNVALAVDGEGKELVVFGRGVGFPAMPYELTDLSRIQRVFRDVRSGCAQSPREKLAALAEEIVEMAQAELGCALNPNLPLTLADHLGFAIERYQNGPEQRMPLACDVAHFYPAETALGRRALQLLKERLGVALPEDEAVHIALHLIDGELEHSDLDGTLLAMQVLGEITQIIEQALHVKLDTACTNYSRFALYIRYMLQRDGRSGSGHGGQEGSGMSDALRPLARQFPEVYSCMQRVMDTLASVCGLRFDPDDKLYLFLHINQIRKHTVPPERAQDGPKSRADAGQERPLPGAES